MKALGILALGAATLVVSGCSVLPGRSSISGDWSCRAIGVSACQSIAHNDITNDQVGMDGAQVIATSASRDYRVYGSDRPTLFGRHVMRVTIAPWVDEDGRYHAASTIFAPTGAEIWGVPSDREMEQ